MVQRALFERVHGAPALVFGLQSGQHAEVALFATGYALSHRAVLGAARLLLQTQLAGSHTVQPVGSGAQALLRVRKHICK